MAELPLHPTPQARGEEAHTELEAALDACERLLEGDLRPDGGSEFSFPIRIALEHSEHGPWVRRFLAGDPARPDRLDAARWRVLHADLPQALRELARKTWPHLEEGMGPRLQLRVSEMLSRLGRARGAPPPRLTSLTEERDRALDMGRRFLVDDPTLSETVEIHRWGLFGRNEVRGGVYNRLVACAWLQGWRLPLEEALGPILDQADSDGWRHFPTLRQVPRDAELGGLILQVARSAGWTAHPLVRQTEQDLVAHLDADGLPGTWLGTGTPGETATETHDWPRARCPIAAAMVLLGLWHIDAAAHANRVRHGLGSLAAWVLAHPTLSSPFATETLCAVRVLQALRGVEPGRWREAEAVLIDRLRGRQQQSGRFGSSLETAMSAVVLARADALEWPDVTVRALVDSQQADGGWPTGVLRSLVLHPTAPKQGSRVLTTAACLRALEEIVVPTPGS